MSDHIDYYLSLNSPWSYLGHKRLSDLAARYDVPIRIHPIDYSRTVFPATGGLPVHKRAPERQAYRLTELARWRDFLGIELNIHPAHWPVDERTGAGMVLAAREAGADAVGFAGACLRAVWAEERDISDPQTLRAIAGQIGGDGATWRETTASPDMQALYERESTQAIERGVFGAPSYVFRDELFWGQDRLEFLGRALAAS